MINVTTAFRQALYNDDRRYLEYADITLDDTNQTVLHVTNENIWQGGFSIEDSVGEDNTFSALGSTIINSCTIVLNNIYETYSEYDFTNAKVVVAVGLELPNPNDSTTTYIEKAWKGDFYVDEATYNGSIITLKCLDDMKQFDRPYSQSTLSYPATLGTIVNDACTRCGVELGTLNFPHKDYSIPTRPEDEKVTFREVIGWCATIAGCFARFAYYPTANKSKLELKWFNQTALEQHAQGTDGGSFDNGTPRYSTGDTLDGGTFNPWNTGDVADAGAFTDERPYHHIVSLYNHNISVDDVVITGVRTTVKDDDDDSATETITALTGTEGYVIDIADNEFITKTNATEIRTWLGQQLIGLTFRKASVSHPSDPSIEAGDIAFVYDRKGNEYPILVTRTVFNGFGTQTTVCGADTPNRNSATRYTQVTKSYVETRKKMKEQKNQYDQALDDLAEAVKNAQGMYETVEAQTGGGYITYIHNKPTLSESDVVIKISSVGITVTSNYSDPSPTWYGMTVDGNLITSILNTIGVNADWINTGSLSANRISGGTLKLGGSNNGYGKIQVYSDNDKLVGEWENDNLKITSKISYSGGNIPSGYAYRQTYFGSNGVISFSDIDSESGSSYDSGLIDLHGAHGRIFVDTHGTRNSKYFEIKISNGTNASGAELRLGFDPSGNAYYQLPASSTSSKRYKHDISDNICDELDPHKLYDLKFVQFVYNEDRKDYLEYPDMEGLTIGGFIAEDVDEIYPSAVVHGSDGMVQTWDERRILPPMLALIQEQKKEIDELKKRIEKLEKLMMGTFENPKKDEN